MRYLFNAGGSQRSVFNWEFNINEFRLDCEKLAQMLVEPLLEQYLPVLLED